MNNENIKSNKDKIVVESAAHLKIIDTSELQEGAIVVSFYKEDSLNPRAILMKEGSNLTVYDGNIYGLASAIHMNKDSKVTIKGGNFANIGDGNTIVMANTSNLYISGGTFSKKNPSKKLIYVNKSAEKSVVTLDGVVFDVNDITQESDYILVIK
jgi:hypothetical protein